MIGFIASALHVFAILLIDHFLDAARQDVVSGVPKPRGRNIVRLHLIDAA